MKFTFFPKSNSTAGFSLVEILVGLTLLAIAGTFVMSNIFERMKEGQINATKTQINQLAGTVKEYRRKCNSYPSTDQGLDALINKPSSGKECKRYPNGGFLEKAEIPVDPWDNEFVYESDGKTFNISSFGPDQEEGSEDDINYNKKSE